MNEQKQARNDLINEIRYKQTSPNRLLVFPDWEAPGQFGPHLHLPVVRRGFVELLAEPEGDLEVLEGGLRSDAHLPPAGADAELRLLEGSQVPDGDGHPCGPRGQQRSLGRLGGSACCHLGST